MITLFIRVLLIDIFSSRDKNDRTLCAVTIFGWLIIRTNIMYSAMNVQDSKNTIA